MIQKKKERKSQSHILGRVCVEICVKKKLKTIFPLYLTLERFVDCLVLGFSVDGIDLVSASDFCVESE